MGSQGISTLLTRSIAEFATILTKQNFLVILYLKLKAFYVRISINRLIKQTQMVANIVKKSYHAISIT